MSYQLTIRRDAEADIREAFDYYESCREGLGHEFLLCIEAGLENIRRNPLLFRTIYKSVMRSMIHRFPYGIYFLIRDEKIIVFAVMHARRASTRWQERT